MDTTHTDLAHLFEQLGLPSSSKAIEGFIGAHPIPEGVKLVDAPFWNEAQRTFLTEALAEDAQWSDTIDHLDAQLRS
ncbi:MULTISPECIES: DUF2789 domain-containing protein [Shewanella]|nr:DUF2789 domain-containing protein [Shewanella algae]MBC8795708.1 DUF2789 domain-containing protein [Shewanella algae]MBO2617044.1 DUF2789 domain-containing protein [Shewanella algae]MBO2646402.1 DUF2789 domain-containing protein [Shewanella algae]MBO2663322.1 DUF2789 domain-containing protein [Shewanella algae]MBO2701585.1 DUF2789 domain-containing protein [Shewanella algae]